MKFASMPDTKRETRSVNLVFGRLEDMKYDPIEAKILSWYRPNIFLLYAITSCGLKRWLLLDV